MNRFLALGAAIVALPLFAGAAAAAGIEVTMNQAKIVKLARPADTVVVGEPRIADVAVKDATTVVLTGKGFGVTNLVILDADGSPIVDEQVYVRRSVDRTLRVYRRSEVQTLSCAPYCEAEFQSEAAAASDSSLGSN